RPATDLTPPPWAHPMDEPMLLASAAEQAHAAEPPALFSSTVPAADAVLPPQARHPTPLPQPYPTPPQTHPTPPFAPSVAYPLPAPAPQPAPRRREATSVHVAGFWSRLIAAAIDLAIVIPAAVVVALLAGWATGLRLPTNLHILDVDLWIDLVLASDPALVMGLVLLGAIGLTYLLVFQIIVGQTLGMRLLRIKIIDVYGDRPSAPRCIARCAGYLAGVATLFLGFLWMGFDSEKRGLQDWIAGTYVIRA
ncbi:MAG TPA: RDD family protein, partial [Kofleriaceae bacterium]|nr:RDD family protein [Kofleriaceae bacterium]